MPDDHPTCHELLADANHILGQDFNWFTQGATPTGIWRRRYQRWLARQNHSAARSTGGDAA